MKLLWIFHNVSKTNFLRVIVAINRVSFIIAPMASTAFLECLHSLCINLVRIFMP